MTSIRNWIACRLSGTAIKLIHDSGLLLLAIGCAIVFSESIPILARLPYIMAFGLTGGFLATLGWGWWLRDAVGTPVTKSVIGEYLEKNPNAFDPPPPVEAQEPARTDITTEQVSVMERFKLIKADYDPREEPFCQINTYPPGVTLADISVNVEPYLNHPVPLDPVRVIIREGVICIIRASDAAIDMAPSKMINGLPGFRTQDSYEFMNELLDRVQCYRRSVTAAVYRLVMDYDEALRQNNQKMQCLGDNEQVTFGALYSGRIYHIDHCKTILLVVGQEMDKAACDWSRVYTITVLDTEFSDPVTQTKIMEWAAPIEEAMNA